MYIDILKQFIKDVSPFNTLPLDVKSITPYDCNIYTVLSNNKRYAIYEVDYVAGNEFTDFNNKLSELLNEKVLTWIPLIKSGRAALKTVTESDSDYFIFRKNDMNYLVAELEN